MGRAEVPENRQDDAGTHPLHWLLALLLGAGCGVVALVVASVLLRALP